MALIVAGVALLLASQALRPEALRRYALLGAPAARRMLRAICSREEFRNMTACIVGWAHTPFGKRDDETVESLIVRVTREALDHAGIGPEDVDEVVLGHFNAGFSPQDFTASLVFQASDAFRFKPATPRRECLRHRFGGGASGDQDDRGEARPHGARRRRRADDDDARPRDRQEPPEGLLPARGRRHARRASPASSARSRAPISSATATSPTRSR